MTDTKHKTLVMTYCPSKKGLPSSHSRVRRYFSYVLGLDEGALERMFEFQHLFPNWTGRMKGKLYSPMSAAVSRAMSLKLNRYNAVIAVGEQVAYAFAPHLIRKLNYGRLAMTRRASDIKTVAMYLPKMEKNEVLMLVLPEPIGRADWYHEKKNVAKMRNAIVESLLCPTISSDRDNRGKPTWGGHSNASVGSKPTLPPSFNSQKHHSKIIGEK